MTTESHRVTVERDGQTLAEATLAAAADLRHVHADLHVQPGQLPADVRAELVDAVVDHDALQPAEQLTATLPAGDAELLHRLRERCGDVDARSAGSTVLADVPLPPA